ncbi:hypothetical protein [Streptomyces sp. NPDC046942]
MNSFTPATRHSVPPVPWSRISSATAASSESGRHQGAMRGRRGRAS